MNDIFRVIQNLKKFRKILTYYKIYDIITSVSKSWANKNGGFCMNKSTLSMILGLVSLLLGIVGFFVQIASKVGGWLAFIALICGIVAVVFSSAAKKEGGQGGNAGIVMGIIGIVISVIAGISCILCNACGVYDAVEIAKNSAGDLSKALADLEDLY